MPRFHLPPESRTAGALRLTGREAHHALDVLRLKPGDALTLLDGAGQTSHCTIASVGKGILNLQEREVITVAPPACPITLFVAVPKGKLIEDIIQKAVELGVQKIVPLLTDRVVMHLDAAGAEAKRDKWQHVAIEAIKQCGAAWLPQVAPPQSISASLTAVPAAELSLVGSLQTARRHPREWVREFQRQNGRLPHSASVWIGPEGDFTLAELQTIEAAGARPITLGDLILRVETAAVYCLSFLNYELRG